MKTNGHANKTLILGGANSHREQRINNKGANIKNRASNEPKKH